MDVLSEWLGETIEQELGQALAWRDHDGSQPPSTSKIEHRNIEDDGKNLRVQVSKGGLLQINKVGIRTRLKYPSC